MEAELQARLQQVVWWIVHDVEGRVVELRSLYETVLAHAQGMNLEASHSAVITAIGMVTVRVPGVPNCRMLAPAYWAQTFVLDMLAANAGNPVDFNSLAKSADMMSANGPYSSVPERALSEAIQALVSIGFAETEGMGNARQTRLRLQNEQTQGVAMCDCEQLCGKTHCCAVMQLQTWSQLSVGQQSALWTDLPCPHPDHAQR